MWGETKRLWLCNDKYGGRKTAIQLVTLHGGSWTVEIYCTLMSAAVNIINVWPSFNGK